MDVNAGQRGMMRIKGCQVKQTPRACRGEFRLQAHMILREAIKFGGYKNSYIRYPSEELACQPRDSLPHEIVLFKLFLHNSLPTLFYMKNPDHKLEGFGHPEIQKFS